MTIRAFSLPGRRALAREYLIWSFGIAAISGMNATRAVLRRDPQGIYDPERDIVQALVTWFLAVFLVATMPLTLMALRVFIWTRIRRGYRTLRDLFRGRTQREAPNASSAREIAPAGGAGNGERENQASGVRLLLEYVLMMTLVAPFFSLIVMAVLGGFQFYVPFFSLVIGLIAELSLLDDLLSVLLAILLPLGPEIGHVIGAASAWLILLSVPTAIAACPAFCVAVRLLLKFSLAKALARK